MIAGRLAGDEPRGLAVVHNIPGRLRLRLPYGARTAGLPEAISVLSGVAACAWSPRTRGLLVRYRPDTITAEAIAKAVAERAEVSDDVILAAPAVSMPAASNGRSTVSASVEQAVGELNRRLGRATHGALDLAGVVPVALAVWAIAELLRGRLAPLTWSTALWYAHGLFRDYNPPSVEA